jgi:outer membrane protein assembly factor BamB
MRKLWLKFGLIYLNLLTIWFTACGDQASQTNPTTTVPVTATSASTPASTLTSTPPTVTTTVATNNRPSIPPATSTSSSPEATSSPAATSNSTSNSNEDWPTYHRDNLRTGYLPNVPDPKNLALKWNVKLDGAVYAQPLVIGTQLIVATEANSLYSLDTQTGKEQWHANFGKPVPRSALPCGNIDPLGITGTPVYDPATSLIFAVAEVTGPSHQLVGVDLKTGQVKVRRSADPAGMKEIAPHQQRAALSVSQGLVYIAYGGLYGDCGNYHGWVVAARTDGQGDLLSFQVPTKREGGIWAAAGAAIDANGKVYVAVGNGEETEGQWDHSDSVLRLSSDLKLEDGFAPKEWQQDNERDDDLGSLGPVLLPNGYIFIAGKSGVTYSLKANNLGGIGGQVQSDRICDAYGGAATVDNRVFVPCSNGLQEITVGNDGKLTPGWRVEEVTGSPIVAGKTVYSIDATGKLYAIDRESGNIRANLTISPTSRFATPVLSKGLVFVGTMTGISAISLS